MRCALILLVSLAVLTVVGCDSGCRGVDPVRDDPPPDIIMFCDINDVMLFKDAASITGIWIRHDVIHLRVEYSGGCRPHDFILYGWCGFLKSNPAQAEIYLSHNANGDACEALITADLLFDLAPLRKTYQRSYGPRGPILLRLHEPGATEPVLPLPKYEF
jgi:hypothetical protein